MSALILTIMIKFSDLKNGTRFNFDRMIYIKIDPYFKDKDGRYINCLCENHIGNPNEIKFFWFYDEPVDVIKE